MGGEGEERNFLKIKEEREGTGCQEEERKGRRKKKWVFEKMKKKGRTGRGIWCDRKRACGAPATIEGLAGISFSLLNRFFLFLF